MSSLIRKFECTSKRYVALLLMFATIAASFMVPAMRPQEAQAFTFSTTYIQMGVDASAWTLIGGVVSIDTNQVINSHHLEARRIGSSALTSLAVGSDSVSAGAELLKALDTKAGLTDFADGAKENLVLTFPGGISANLVGWKSSSNDNDTARANAVKDALLYDLNSAFLYVHGGRYIPAGTSTEDRVEQYKSDMAEFLTAVAAKSSYNGYMIAGATASQIKKPYDNTTTAADYISIYPIGDATKKEFYLYRIPKGYSGTTVVPGLSESTTDTEYVNWGMLAYEAFANISQDEDLMVTPDTVYNSTPSSFEKTFINFLGSIITFIQGALGLWTLDSLVFSSGVRGGASYVGGIFPTSWEPIIWTLFFVMEVIAVILLIYALIQNVFKKAASTVNPAMRVSVMEQVKDLCVVAIVLSLLPIILRICISLSGQLAGIFADAVGTATTTERFNGMGAASGSLGGAILQLFYLGALIYFNFFYTMRALTVALLIVLAPIFIVFFAMGQGAKKLAFGWVKELAANIFIQPIHALILALLLLLPSSGRAFENIIVVYALIPFTAVIRGLFFGQAGGLIHQAADRARSGVTKAATIGALGAAAGAFGGVVAAGSGVASGIKGAMTGAKENNAKGAESGSKDKGDAKASGEAVAAGVGSNPALTKAGAGVGAAVGAETSDGSDTVSATTADGGIKEAAREKPEDNSQNHSNLYGATTGALKVASGVAMSTLGSTAYAMSRRVFGRGMVQYGQKLATSGGERFGTAITGKYNSKTKGTGAQEMQGAPGATKAMAGVTTGESGAEPRTAFTEASQEAAASTPPIVPGQASESFYEGATTETQLPDGTAEYNIGRDSLPQHGFDSIVPREDGQGMVMTTNRGLSAGDQATLATAARITQSGTPAQKAEMAQKLGYDSVSPIKQRQGGQETTVGYRAVTNENFGKTMGADWRVAQNGDLSISQSGGHEPYKTPQIQPPVMSVGENREAVRVETPRGVSISSTPSGGSSVDIDTRSPDVPPEIVSRAQEVVESPPEYVTQATNDNGVVHIEYAQGGFEQSVKEATGGTLRQTSSGSSYVVRPTEQPPVPQSESGRPMVKMKTVGVKSVVKPKPTAKVQSNEERGLIFEEGHHDFD